MALQKTIKSSIGVDLKYWRILQITYDYDRNLTAFVLEGYPTQAVRNQTPKPDAVQTYMFQLSGTDKNRKTIYDEMKNKTTNDVYGNPIDLTNSTDV